MSLLLKVSVGIKECVVMGMCWGRRWRSKHQWKRNSELQRSVKGVIVTSRVSERDKMSVRSRQRRDHLGGDGA